MTRYYVLTSNQVPVSGWVTEEVLDENRRTIGQKISTEISYALTEVPSLGSLEKVPVSDNLKFVAFLQKEDGDELFDADEEIEIYGVVGDVRKTGGLTHQLIAVDGTIVNEWDDDDICHRILPPEFFGLKRFPWWENDLF